MSLYPCAAAYAARTPRRIYESKFSVARLRWSLFGNDRSETERDRDSVRSTDVEGPGGRIGEPRVRFPCYRRQEQLLHLIAVLIFVDQHLVVIFAVRTRRLAQTKCPVGLTLDQHLQCIMLEIAEINDILLPLRTPERVHISQCQVDQRSDRPRCGLHPLQRQDRILTDPFPETPDPLFDPTPKILRTFLLPRINAFPVRFFPNRRK